MVSILYLVSTVRFSVQDNSAGPIVESQHQKNTIKMLLPALLSLAVFASVSRASPDSYQIETMLDSMPWFFNSDQKAREAKEEHAVCKTESCKRTAERIKRSMNSSVDPCVDFYEYACGGWQSNNPMPLSETIWDQTQEIQTEVNNKIRAILEEPKKPDDVLTVKAAKQLYAACMNTDEIERMGISPIEKILEKRGGWPIVMDLSEWNLSELSWQKVENYYNREYRNAAFFSLGVHVDPKNANAHVLTLDQPSLLLPRSMLVDRDQFAKQISIYSNFIEEVIAVFAESKGSGVPWERIRKDVKDMVDFEIDLATILSPKEMRRSMDRMYNLVTIRQLQKWYNRAKPQTSTAKINWLKVIQNLFNGVGKEIKMTDKILMPEMDYIFKLASLLDKTSPIVVVNYVHWKVVRNFLPYTNNKMRNITFSIEKELYGIEEQFPRWRVCVYENEMAHAVSYQYVKKYFPEGSKISALRMVDEIKEGIEVQMTQSDWMDKETKLSAKEKLRNMKQFIGYPDWYNNASAVLHYYRGLKVGPVYFDNVIHHKAFSLKKMLRRLSTPVNKEEWLVPPITLNAFYSPSANALTFPAVILQEPLFSSLQPESVNYGGIGSVIGHEISHGFDDGGRQFDKNGNALQWWTDSTIRAYNDRAQCFVDQFNNYSIKELSSETKTFFANGDLTQGENIADSTGLQAVYMVYQTRTMKTAKKEPRLPGLENFDQNQLFFLSYANSMCDSMRKEFLLYIVKNDEHSPGRLRVTGSVSNLDGFGKAFNCPLGSPMNPKHKCNLWK